MKTLSHTVVNNYQTTVLLIANVTSDNLDYFSTNKSLARTNSVLRVIFQELQSSCIAVGNSEMFELLQTFTVSPH